MSDRDGLYSKLVLIRTQVGQDPPVEHALQFDVGWYSIDDMISTLTSKINTIIAPDTILIQPSSSVNQRLSFTVLGSTVIQLLAVGLGKQIGIAATTGFVSSYACENLPDLGGVKWAYLHSKTLSSANLLDGAGQIYSTALCIPIRVPFGFTNHFESNDEELNSVMFSTPNNLQRIEIRLYETRPGKFSR